MSEKIYQYADDIVSKAMMFAVAAHSGQLRKDALTPAILHATEAASVAASVCGEFFAPGSVDPAEERAIMAAALLHDTVEDTDVEAEQIEVMFGERVAALVASETEDKHRDLPENESWQVRKETSIRELEATDDVGVKILWLSDKLSNMRSYYRLWRKDGKNLWSRFHNSDVHAQEWYYRSIAAALTPLADTTAYREYVFLMEKVFG